MTPGGPPARPQESVTDAVAGAEPEVTVSAPTEAPAAPRTLPRADPRADPRANPAGPGKPRWRGRVPLISAIAVGCVTALLVAVLATSKDASNVTVAPSPLQNKPAPEIRGPALDGSNGALSGYKGKWVLINFFASWCVPCQQEQPDLVKFQDNHPTDAAIFGVRFDDPDTGPIQSLMNKSGGKWPIVDDANAKIVYSVTGPPESFLVSPGGIVLVHIIGPITDARLEDLLNQAKLVVTTPTLSPLLAPGRSTP